MIGLARPNSSILSNGRAGIRGAAIVLWTLLSPLLGLVSAQAEKRVALVIGNGAYNKVSRQCQAALIKAAGFDVGETKLDLDLLSRSQRSPEGPQ